MMEPMDHIIDAGSLAQADSFALQQTSTMLSNDMSVTTADGTPVATVVTRGGGLSRMLMGARGFDVLDARDDRVLFRLSDPATLGRDVYAMTGPHGEPLAQLRQELSLMRTAVSVRVADGTAYTVTGNLFDHDYQMVAGEVPIARVTAEFRGLMKLLRGRSAYRLDLDPQMPPVVRCAVLGTAVALDLIRAKRSRSS
mgnify:FL=1